MARTLHTCYSTRSDEMQGASGRSVSSSQAIAPAMYCCCCEQLGTTVLCMTLPRECSTPLPHTAWSRKPHLILQACKQHTHDG